MKEEIEAVLAAYEAKLRAGLIDAGTPLEEVFDLHSNGNGNGNGHHTGGSWSPVTFKSSTAAEEALV